jgi:hypothetical protein
MSPSSELDRRIAAYLEVGPDVLPEWVHQGVAEQIHRTPQPSRSAWRFGRLGAFAGYLAAAIMLAIVGTWWLAQVSAPNVGGPSATPLPVASGDLEAGQAYQTQGFSLPLSFRLPAQTEGGEADLLDSHSLRIRPVAGGAITIHHDAALADDLCHPAGLVGDLDSPAEVRAWLRSSPGVTLGPERELPLAGGATALAWDIEMAEDCWIGEQGEVGEIVWLAAGETPRVFAIPVENDVLIAFTWGAGPDGDLEQINPTADALVESIAASDGR